MATSRRWSRPEFVRVELTETQVGLRTRERRAGRSARAGAPGACTGRAWSTWQVEVIDIADVGRSAGSRGGAPRADAAAPACGGGPGRRAAGAGARTRAPASCGSTARSSACSTPGSYAFWKFNRNVAVEPVDLRLQAVEVTGQDILTRDKVGLRLNLSATWRFTDVLEGLYASN